VILFAVKLQDESSPALPVTDAPYWDTIQFPRFGDAFGFRKLWIGFKREGALKVCHATRTNRAHENSPALPPLLEHTVRIKERELRHTYSFFFDPREKLWFRYSCRVGGAKGVSKVSVN
jgi:hypothetical protein